MRVTDLTYILNSFSVTLPRLRGEFLQMLTTLEHGEEGSRHDECAQMMRLLILSAPSAVESHIPHLLKVFQFTSLYVNGGGYYVSCSYVICLFLWK